MKITKVTEIKEKISMKKPLICPDKVSKLYDLVKIQVKCSRQDLSDQYMRGMANGLICALAVFKEWEPIYIEKPTQLETNHANQMQAIKFCPNKKKHGEVICPDCMPIFKALSARYYGARGGRKKKIAIVKSNAI